MNLSRLSLCKRMDLNIFGLFIGGIWADTLPIPPIFLISALIILLNVFLLVKVKFTTVE